MRALRPRLWASLVLNGSQKRSSWHNSRSRMNSGLNWTPSIDLEKLCLARRLPCRVVHLSREEASMASRAVQYALAGGHSSVKSALWLARLSRADSGSPPHRDGLYRGGG